MIGKRLKKIIQKSLLILCTLKKILPDYMSNHNSNRERTIILLMIRNKEKEG